MQQINDRLLSWASTVDPHVVEQTALLADMPFVHPWVALMPDVHGGQGPAVGSVIPTLKALIPGAVGTDIGCGMIAVRTQFHSAELPADRRALREAIERAVPLSKGRYNTKLTATASNRIDQLLTKAEQASFVPEWYSPNWELQLGTLGGGNHFIEVSADETDQVWLFLHSGSRGIGHKIATHHMRVARELCERWWIPLPAKELAYLPEGAGEFWHYVRELLWAQHFALLNREEMMDRVIACVSEWHEPVKETDRIACHHNYAAEERHFGRKLWVTRRGAINAEAGRRGLIPGSMGTASYVVVGKGERLALNSAPHGAGRLHSRRKAREVFSSCDLRAAMDGIEWAGRDEFLDEIPGAYRDVDVVMADAKDLVEPVHRLRQLVNVKGE